MIEYIYILKCPDREDEFFDFLEDAKICALKCMSQKPIITQTEVERNDFGECTDHHDLGTVWSWEDMMTDTEPTKSIFTKDDLKDYIPDNDSEFDDDDFCFDTGLIEAVAPTKISFKNKEAYEEFIKLCSEIGIVTGADLKRFMADNNANDGNLLDKLREYRDELGTEFKIKECNQKRPIPEGMTIEQLVEEMEENEDTVECTLCNDLFDKSTCRKELNLGWLCRRCADDLVARGEGPVFKEDNYWDFLDEDITAERSIEDLVRDSISHLVNDLGKDSSTEDFVDDVILDIERNYDNFVPDNPENHRKWASAIACEVSRQLNNQPQLDEELETKTWICEFDGKEIGTVEATTEEEAYLAMERKYYDLPYGLYDGVAMVYPADEEELTETAELHDLGNKYDGGYPTEKPELPEIEEAEASQLKLCPECGKESFDIETGICVECGFN